MRAWSPSTSPRTRSPSRARTSRGRTSTAGSSSRRGDLLAGVAGPFDLVVSNPPYVPAAEYDSLQPEIRLYEPYGAVVGDRVWEQIAREARRVLVPGGWLVLECGDGQAADVSAGLEALGYEAVLATPDLAGRDRVVEAHRP